MKTFHRILGTTHHAAVAALILGAVLLAFSVSAVAQYSEPETCMGSVCHSDQYNDWKVSGHPYKLMKAEEAQNRPIPLPEGYTWDNISYVIGGYKWKSRYMDLDGYILTQDGDGTLGNGNTQYNNFTGQWSDYNANLENGTKPYDCGRCHTTGWVENPDPTDLSGNQDMLPGIHGTFFAGGIQCQACHGTSHPGNIPAMDETGGCADCHIRGDANTIPASGGFVRHHEQYNEHLASPHAAFNCSDCHNPHKKGEFSIKESAECGVACHSGIAASYAETSMYDYDVTCEDCHMPYATKSAKALGPEIDGNQTHGDVMTHIFSIDTDPAGDMFTEDGGFVALDSDGKAKVTMNYACQRCHLTSSLEELGRFAENFHGRSSSSLEGLGIDPGLSGHWWDSTRSGEGFMMEVAYVGDDVFVFMSFYAYDAAGNRTYLFAQGLVDPGATTVDLTIVMPEGGQWGENFDPAAVSRPEWGVGTFMFPDCENATYEFIPNQVMMDMGYTTISGNLTRDLLDVGIACPTFVNNAN
ncbi:MAG: hypothetical protein HKP02_11470 [Xanthomonadales bacterium]|nr:hypothetical protein [Xanthomonadales bacterium]